MKKFGILLVFFYCCAAMASFFIPNGSIGKAQLAAVGQQISSSSGSFLISSISPTFADVTNMTVTITTTGRPVVIGMVADGTTSFSSIGVTVSPGSNNIKLTTFLKLFRAATVIDFMAVGDTMTSTPSPPFSTTTNNHPCSSLYYVDVPAAGTYTYKVQAAIGDASGAGFVTNCKMYAYEL